MCITNPEEDEGIFFSLKDFSEVDSPGFYERRGPDCN